MMLCSLYLREILVKIWCFGIYISPQWYLDSKMTRINIGIRAIAMLELVVIIKIGVWLYSLHKKFEQLLLLCHGIIIKSPLQVQIF